MNTYSTQLTISSKLTDDGTYKVTRGIFSTKV